MKFYRMDSDCPDWQCWDVLYERVGRRDFHKAKALYHDLYSYMAQSFNGDPESSPKIVLSKVAKSARMSRSKVAQMLPIVGSVFAFELRIVEQNAVGEPLVVELFYPTFLKKQRKFSRNGDGKFIHTATPYGGESNTRQDKNNINNPLTPLEGGNFGGDKKNGRELAREKKEAIEIFSTFLSANSDPRSGRLRPSRESVAGTAELIRKKFGIETLRAMQGEIIKEEALGLVRWDPKWLLGFAEDVYRGSVAKGVCAADVPPWGGVPSPELSLETGIE